jgi:hypothetical protein
VEDKPSGRQGSELSLFSSSRSETGLARARKDAVTTKRTNAMVTCITVI